MKRRSANRRSTIPVAPPKNNSNLPASQGQTLGGSLLGNLALGATIGAGSSLGHRAVDAVMAPSSNTEPVNSENSKPVDCNKLMEMMDTCLRNEHTNCDFLVEMINKKCNV